jgi:hypothetical protein
LFWEIGRNLSKRPVGIVGTFSQKNTKPRFKFMGIFHSVKWLRKERGVEGGSTEIAEREEKQKRENEKEERGGESEGRLR